MAISEVIYIENIAVMDNFPTPEFPYSVTWLFPYELNKEEVFKNNLSHTLNDLKEFIEQHELLDGNKRIYERLKFDSQKEKQMRCNKECEKKISEIENKLNEGISPYYWKIFKDINSYWSEVARCIKADYVLVLYGG